MGWHDTVLQIYVLTFWRAAGMLPGSSLGLTALRLRKVEVKSALSSYISVSRPTDSSCMMPGPSQV